ncbi:hypothetical protein B0H13DRAFT_1870761 [Mycena leptocephala]|nr:hypothetical protein B0H13DRAFT_1870761 [Mycena leptocephala]
MSCKLQFQAQATSNLRPLAEAIQMEHSLRGSKDRARVGIDIREVEISTREGQSKKVVTRRISELVEFVLLSKVPEKVWSPESSMVTALTLQNLIIPWLGSKLSKKTVIWGEYCQPKRTANLNDVPQI